MIAGTQADAREQRIAELASRLRVAFEGSTDLDQALAKTFSSFDGDPWFYFSEVVIDILDS